MKKILYISLLLIGVLAVSCEKQEFVPTSDSQELPKWDEEKSRSVDGDEGGLDDGGSGIVDPDSPEDSGKKKKPNT